MEFFPFANVLVVYLFIVKKDMLIDNSSSLEEAGNNECKTHARENPASTSKQTQGSDAGKI